jgi:hypothetical protein
MGSLAKSVENLYSILPNAFQVHRAYFDDVALFLALEDSIAFSSAHTSHIQQFRSINVVVV